MNPYAYSPSKKGFTKQVQSWMPVSLLNTLLERLYHQKGKYDWRARIMKTELDHILIEGQDKIVREKSK